MKRTLRFSLAAASLALATAFYTPAANASHIEGTDITCVKVGAFTYQVTLKVYRDCSGIPVAPTAPIEVRPVGCPGNPYTTTNLSLSGPGVEVSDVATGQATTCSTPPNNAVHGVQEYTYSGMVTVQPSACATDWEFSYTDCCRNTTLNLYQFGSSIYFYTKAMVRADSAISNSSPMYSANPVPYVCVNDTVTYIAQATDPDGDSLVFSLRPATGSSGLALYYNPGYSGSQPFGASSPLQLDSATGYMKVVPTMLGDFVVVLQVDEYRTINGQVIRVGFSQRDVQYHVVQCSSLLPRLAGNLSVTSGSSSQSVAPGSVIQLRAGQPATITLPTFSGSTSVALNLTSNSDLEIPGSSFTVDNTGPFPVGTFSWTPTAQHIRSTPYYFSFNLSDNAAPFPNEFYGVVRLQVTNILSTDTETAASLHIPNVISPSGSKFSRYFAVPGAIRVSMLL